MFCYESVIMNLCLNVLLTNIKTNYVMNNTIDCILKIEKSIRAVKQLIHIVSSNNALNFEIVFP